MRVLYRFYPEWSKLRVGQNCCYTFTGWNGSCILGTYRSDQPFFFKFIVITLLRGAFTKLPISTVYTCLWVWYSCSHKFSGCQKDETRNFQRSDLCAKPKKATNFSTRQQWISVVQVFTPWMNTPRWTKNLWDHHCTVYARQSVDHMWSNSIQSDVRESK